MYRENRKPVPPAAGPLFKTMYVNDKRSLADILDEYDLSYRRLRKYLQEEGVEFRPARPVRKERLAATAEMIRDYSLMTMRRAARAHGIDHQIFRERLILAGVQIRTQGHPVQQDGPRERSFSRDPWRQPPRDATSLTAAIVEKFEADAPIARIAEWVGLSEEAVAARLARAGYEPDV